MPKLRQRTLFEYSDDPSVNKSSPYRVGTRRAPIQIESDDSDDPSRIHFERKNEASDQSNEVDNDSVAFEPALTPRKDSPSAQKQVTRKLDHGKRHKRLIIISDDSESDTQITTKRRKLVKGKKVELIGDKEDDVEDEGEENLEEEVDRDRILSTRLRLRKKTDFSRHLERLQRRRRGKGSESEDEESEGVSGSSSTNVNNSSCPFEGARSLDIEEEADDSSMNEDHDFIVPDDDGQEVPELPAAFSMGTYQDLSHHFKIICQLFVHLAVEEPRKRRSLMDKEMNKTYFSIPFAIARRKLSGMRDSLVTSSTWKPDFKKPLESFPDLRLERLEHSIPLCDACHIGGRIATLRGVIGGGEYDRHTFEMLEEGSAETISDSEEGDKIEWHLGRFCAARAQVFHLFSHWEYILYRSLRAEVERLRAAFSVHTCEKARVYLPASQGAPPPGDPNDADGIMDWLDGRGIINLEWVRIKSMMDRAHKLEWGNEVEEDMDLV